MKFTRIVVGPFEVNSFLLEGVNGEALIVDPGADAATIWKACRQKKLTPVGILLTHGHMDHLNALAAVADAAGAPVYLHEQDEAWAFSETNHMLPHYPAPQAPSTPVHPLRDGEHIRLAGLDIRVIATPGHTPGGVCFYLPAEHVLFSGDTLFKGTVGRTDIPGASARVLSESLRKLVRLPPQTVVWPGHGDPTTIGEECLENFFMAQALKSQAK